MGSDQETKDGNGNCGCSSADTGESCDDSTATSSTPLTLAEKRVLHLVAQSKTNREIAQCLGISSATVKRHIENILRKFNLRNRVEAAIFALSLQRCPNGNKACPLELWWRKIT
jgi:DNA-binding CsgD family transcriptional regulator